MKTQITDKQRIDFLESLEQSKTDSDIHIHPGPCDSFSMYLRGNRHIPGAHNNIPARSHYGGNFRAMIDSAIIQHNAGGEAQSPEKRS